MRGSEAITIARYVIMVGSDSQAPQPASVLSTPYIALPWAFPDFNLKMLSLRKSLKPSNRSFPVANATITTCIIEYAPKSGGPTERPQLEAMLPGNIQQNFSQRLQTIYRDGPASEDNSQWKVDIY